MTEHPDWTPEQWDTWSNECVAAGALFMLLSMQAHIEVDVGPEGSVLVAKFDFLDSPYKITVSQIKEGET